MSPAEPAGYRLTPKAEADLEDIWRHGAASWSPEQADRYLDGLVATIELLVAMPTLARERTEVVPPVRIHPSGPHLLVYRIDGETLIVLRVPGARQTWRALLEGTPG